MKILSSYISGSSSCIARKFFWFKSRTTRAFTDSSRSCFATICLRKRYLSAAFHRSCSGVSWSLTLSLRKFRPTEISLRVYPQIATFKASWMRGPRKRLQTIVLPVPSTLSIVIDMRAAEAAAVFNRLSGRSGTSSGSRILRFNVTYPASIACFNRRGRHVLQNKSRRVDG